jgi:ATP-dependent Clp protease adaptor protein ClpS
LRVSTLTPPRERLDRGEGTGLGRPWSVIVLNDNHNTFEGVAFALSAVIPGVSYDKGMSLANRIHETGLAIVWSGEKEPAELYWEQLRPRAHAGAAREPRSSGRSASRRARRRRAVALGLRVQLGELLRRARRESTSSSTSHPTIA